MTCSSFCSFLASGPKMRWPCGGRISTSSVARCTFKRPRTASPCSYHLATTSWAFYRQRRVDNPRNFGDDGGFVFPAKSQSGHVHDARKQAYQKDEKGQVHKTRSLAAPYCCKREFITVARLAGVDLLTRKRLVGHSTSADVTEGYDVAEFSELQTATNRIAAALLARRGLRSRLCRCGRGVNWWQRPVSSIDRARDF